MKPTMHAVILEYGEEAIGPSENQATITGVIPQYISSQISFRTVWITAG